ncbi:MAG: glycosyltransferase family 2 protein [Myxococcota bacterium]|nr:glycosyltransferase family 2 protein [Myxococcota bacterium]
MHAILIPAFNEAESLPFVLEKCQTWSPNTTIIVVDNGSSDDTALVANAHGATVLSCPDKGYANALKHGYQWALESGVSALVQLDADGQHPPHVIPAFFQRVRNCDWVIGSRHGLGCLGAWERRFAAAAVGPMIRHHLSTSIYDWSSGMWGLNTKALRFLFEIFPQPVTDANIRILAIKSGIQIQEHPVAMFDRSTGRSMHDGFEGTLNLFKSAWYAGRALFATE